MSSQEELDWRQYAIPVEPEPEAQMPPTEVPPEQDWRQYAVPVEPEPAAPTEPVADWRQYAVPVEDETLLGKWGITEFVQEWDQLTDDTKTSIASTWKHMGSSALESVSEALDLVGADATSASVMATAEEMREVAHSMMMEHRALEDPNMLQQAFMSAATSMSVSLPLMVAAAITKHPGLAAAAFGGTETMRAYSENRAMGMGKRQSLIHAGTSGVIESATEFIPFQQFTKLWSGRVGNSIAGRFTKYMASELVGENIAEVSQRWNDALLGDAEAPDWEEIKHIMALTTLSTVMASGAQGGLASGVSRGAAYVEQMRGKLEEDPELREIAEQAIKAWEESDAAAESGLMPDLTIEQAQAHLRPLIWNLRNHFKDDPELAAIVFPPDIAERVVGKKSEVAAAVEAALSEPGVIEGRAEEVTAKTVEDSAETISKQITESTIRAMTNTDDVTAAVKHYRKDDLVKAAESLGLPTSGTKRDIGLRIQKHQLALEEAPTTEKEPTPATPQKTTVKRTKDFATEGTYDVVLPDGRKTQIYRDTQQFGYGVWYEVAPPGEQDRYLGNTKKEAIERLEQRAQETAEEDEVNRDLPDTWDSAIPLQPIHHPDQTWSRMRRTTVLKNPSLSELKRMVASAREGSEYDRNYGLRWLKDDRGNYYFWPAEDGIHFDIRRRLQQLDPELVPAQETEFEWGEDFISKQDVNKGRLRGYNPEQDSLYAQGPNAMDAQMQLRVMAHTWHAGSRGWMSVARKSKSVLLLKNPSLGELKRLVADSEEGLRAMIDTRENWYFWDAENAIHDDIIAGLEHIDPDFYEDDSARWAVTDHPISEEEIKSGEIRRVTHDDYAEEGEEIEYEYFPDRDHASSWDAPPDWIPFDDGYYASMDSDGATVKIEDVDGRERIAQGLEPLPALFVKTASMVGYMEGGNPAIPAQYTRGMKHIRIRKDALFDEMGPWYLAHEVGHSISFWEGGEFGAGLAMQSPFYAMDLQKESYGPVINEAIRAWEKGGKLIDQVVKKIGYKGSWSRRVLGPAIVKGAKSIGYSGPQITYIKAYLALEYPFAYLPESIDHVAQIASERTAKGKKAKPLWDHHLRKADLKPGSFFIEELFAQQYAMYHHESDVLKDVMPQAAKLFEEIHEIGSTEIEFGVANSRIRKVLRAQGSGLRSEELSELARSAGDSLNYEEADPGVRDARDQRRRKRRDLVPAGRRLWNYLLEDKTWFSWGRALGALPLQEKYTDLRSYVQGLIHRAELLERRVYDLLNGLDEDTGFAVYQYLTDANSDPSIIPDVMVTGQRTRQRGKKGRYETSIRKEAAAIKRMIRNIGQRLVDVGLLEQEVFEANKDEYLPRMYLKHLLGEEGVQMLANKGSLDLNWLKQRKDLTDWEKQILLGQIHDPSFLVPMTVGRTMRDLALYRFMEIIAKNDQWVAPASLVHWEIPDPSTARYDADGHLVGMDPKLHTEDDPELGVAAGDPQTLSVTPQWLITEGERIINALQHYPQRMRETARITAQAMIKHGQQELQGQSFNTRDFVLIPNSPSYGALRGAWVRKEIANDLRGALKVDIAAGSKLDKLMGWERLSQIQSGWKLNKVALNPPTVARNVMSNWILMNVLGGMPFVFSPTKWNPVKMFFSDSINEMYNKGKYYRIALKYGIAKASFSDSELLKLRHEWERLAKEGGKFKNMLGIGHKMARKLAEFGGNSYQGIEMMGKIAVIKYSMEKKGMTAREAVRAANRALFDYSLVPQWVEFLRKYPIAWPFITFQYKVVPALTETLLTNPQRFLPYVALYFGWKLAAMATLDIDDEEELDRARAGLAEWVRDNPGLLPMPFKDDEGRFRFFDISYIFPWSMPLSMMKQGLQGEYAAALGETGIGSGVVPDILAGLKTNRHPFYKKEIWLENDPGSVKMAKAIEYIWNVWAPGFLTTVSANPPVKMYEAVRQRSSVYKEPPTKGEAWARLFGINLYTVQPNDIGRNMYFLGFEIEEYIRQKTAQMKQEPWRKDEIRAEMKDRVIDLRRDMIDYQEEAGLIDAARAKAMRQALDYLEE